MTAAELAKGRALREAEQGSPFQGRVTYALSDWLDQHCDELLELASAALQMKAQQAARVPSIKPESTDV